MQECLLTENDSKGRAVLDLLGVNGKRCLHREVELYLYSILRTFLREFPGLDDMDTLARC